MKCSKTDCPGIGRHSPVLLLRKTKKGSPLRAELRQLAICEGHKESATVNDFLSDEGWDKISKKLREAGKGTFSKGLTSIDWQPTEAEVSPEELPF